MLHLCKSSNFKPKQLKSHSSFVAPKINTKKFALEKAQEAQLEEVLAKASEAQAVFGTFTQEQVDKIIYETALAASSNRIQLAKAAIEETKRGVLEDKVIKNHFASEFVYNRYKNTKTCGVIEEDPAWGTAKIAEPLGIIAAVTPVTNPTSTVIFKTMMALKTRNSIVIAAHPAAKKCSIQAAKLLMDAAKKAGAPDNVITWIENPSAEMTQRLMNSKEVSMIWATGGPDIVREGRRTGKPAILSGAGNAPALIDETADIQTAVSSILMSKDFDHGMICASEQSVTVVSSIKDQVVQEFKRRGAHICTPEQVEAVRKVLLVGGHVNKDFVGHSAPHIAKICGFEVPEDTRALIGEVSKIGEEEPWSHEKLSPLLALYVVPSYKEGVQYAKKLVEYGGIGHTAIYYTNEKNRERLLEFERAVPVQTILANTPASQGAIGDIYNFKLEPTLSIPAGSGNTERRISPDSLLRIKNVGHKREHTLWMKVPPKIYFGQNSTPTALSELKAKRVLIVTDEALVKLGYVKRIADILQSKGSSVDIYADVEPDPSFDTIAKGVKKLTEFQPDAIVAFGGGSPMDAAKLMQLLYEYPDISFDSLKLRFMDILKRIYHPPQFHKTKLCCIPTTSGTGSEMTPFAVITDPVDKKKYPLADYCFTPYMAIVDPIFSFTTPKSLVALTGYDALTHAIESYVSVLASHFTAPHSLDATISLVQHLEVSYNTGDQEARKEVHTASALAGLGIANAFVGVAHSMAHQLGAAFHLPHGLACAVVLSHVIKYNSSDHPMKQTSFPQYKFPNAKEKYASLADALKLGGNSNDEKVNLLIQKLEDMKKGLNIPLSIKDAGVSEKDFMDKLDDICIGAFDDQCTVSNPRYPLISELRQLFLDAYHGAPVLKN